MSKNGAKDVWHPDYEGAPSDGSAWLEGEEKEPFRVERGGWCSATESVCASSSRRQLRADAGTHDEEVEDESDDPFMKSLLDLMYTPCGFRVVCESDRKWSRRWPMIERFEIIDHESPRPDADRIIFCDGTGGAIFRSETDLELESLAGPITPPARYRAGTSTEICFRFLALNRAWFVDRRRQQPSRCGWHSVGLRADPQRVCAGTSADNHPVRRNGRFLGSWGEPPATVAVSRRDAAEEEAE